MATTIPSDAATMAYAFITWDTALGRRMCPLATFGSRATGVQTARLVCVDPPRADRESVANADEVRGAIALVVRGGCSFIDKARRLQAAGAAAMILANNTREEPFAMFTMAADDPANDDGLRITIPCVMMCLYDVRELFKQYPPSVKTGVLTLEILPQVREQELVAECERQRLLQQQQPSTSTKMEQQNSSGWGASLKRTTTSLIKRWDSSSTTGETPPSPSPPPDQDTTVENIAKPAQIQDTKPPLFAFVQWATSATEYVLFFAPLADFCVVANNAVYEGACVACDPLLAHEDPVRNAKQLVDAVALVQRGACTFPAKLERVQRCGAVATIVGNDDASDEDAAFVMSVDQIRVDHLTIPAVMVSRRVFTRLLALDKPSHVRIVCLSGEAAAECLARVGTAISLTHVLSAEEGSGEQEEEENELPAYPTTRLHVACQLGDHGKCQQILDECCASESARRELVMARDKLQLTALHHACAATTVNEHIVALLLQLGGQPDARDLALQTPLHYACLRGHAPSVKRLLTASIASQELTTARNIGGATPIHYAAQAGSTACLELLLSVNARRVEGTALYRFDGVDERDVDGATPLHVACHQRHVDCVMYLVAASADLERRDRSGRTPLQIACAMVNDPRHSLAALHIVEKLMDAGAAVVVAENGEDLAIDCVANKAVKRELEVAFLRREAMQSRGQCKQLHAYVETQRLMLRSLETTLEYVARQHVEAKRAAAEREQRLGRQQRQIEQLQVQMKTLLQVLHASGGGVGNGAALLSTGRADAEEEDEGESGRALDAALARDLGRKCCRERQFVLAQTYFERSLELYRLPGVARLLEETRRLQGGAVAAAERTESGGGDDPADDVERLRRMVDHVAAAESTKHSLQREISKLETMEVGSAGYVAALKWLEWLLALPWSEDAEEGGSGQVLALEAAAFDELERLDQEQNQSRRTHAACVIQRAFREQYAVHLMWRAVAAERIQRVFKQFARRRAATDQRMTPSTVETTSVDCAQESTAILAADALPAVVFDPTQDVDTRAIAKLRVAKTKTRVCRGEATEAEGVYRVLQLVRVHQQTGRWAAASDTAQFYVWKAWGPTSFEVQSSLSGPYEEMETATIRYERLLREYHGVQASEHLVAGPMEKDAALSTSAWSSLRASAS